MPSPKPTNANPVAEPLAQSLDACRMLASSHYENFHVLTGLLPKRSRDDFAILYSFCRAADDAADERETQFAALAELTALRRTLDTFADSPSHLPDTSNQTQGQPFTKFIPAWLDLITRHQLPLEPFHHLLDAFVQDQHKQRYESWDEVLHYCSGSANPVGRLVLFITGHASNPALDEMFQYSDATCTALQLANFWQDIARDLTDRNRVYIPKFALNDFNLTEDNLAQFICENQKPDRRFLDLEKYLVEYTRPLFKYGRKLWPLVNPEIRPVIKLFTLGGESVLRLIEKQNYDVITRRPEISRATKAHLYLRTWLSAKLAASKSARIHHRTRAMTNSDPS